MTKNLLQVYFSFTGPYWTTFAHAHNGVMAKGLYLHFYALIFTMHMYLLMYWIQLCLMFSSFSFSLIFLGLIIILYFFNDVEEAR